MKVPQVGDRIRHTEILHDRVSEGEVILILSRQFIYVTDNGFEKFCMFNEDWNECKKTKEDS